LVDNLSANIEGVDFHRWRVAQAEAFDGRKHCRHALYGVPGYGALHVECDCAFAVLQRLNRILLVGFPDNCNVPNQDLLAVLECPELNAGDTVRGGDAPPCT
jgi:hypothetical protein